MSFLSKSIRSPPCLDVFFTHSNDHRWEEEGVEMVFSVDKSKNILFIEIEVNLKKLLNSLL